MTVKREGRMEARGWAEYTLGPPMTVKKDLEFGRVSYCPIVVVFLARSASICWIVVRSHLPSVSSISC